MDPVAPGLAMQGSAFTGRIARAARYLTIVGLGPKDKAKVHAEWGVSPYQVGLGRLHLPGGRASGVSPLTRCACGWGGSPCQVVSLPGGRRASSITRCACEWGVSLCQMGIGRQFSRWVSHPVGWA